MDDASLLLKAILDNPAEDVPRLMYADAIEESDPERAEFIRKSVVTLRAPCWFVNDGFQHRPCREHYSALRESMWRNRTQVWCSRCLDLERCATHYMQDYRKGWSFAWFVPRDWSIAGVDSSAQPFIVYANQRAEPPHDQPDIALHVERGFVSRVECAADQWLGIADGLRAAHPVTRVLLTTPPESTGNINQFALWKKMAKGEPWRSRRWPGVEFDMPTGDRPPPQITKR